jgi:predicted Zn-dependent peptidase
MTERRLENGMTFLIVERHEVPVVSFHLYADVGSVDEEIGQTGMAHMFEHMAFKGTSDIGTRDYPREKRPSTAWMKPTGVFASELEKRGRRCIEGWKPFRAAEAEAGEYAMSDEFTKVIEQAGGAGLNASTSNDATRYYISLPSNKTELWFSLESARFLDPVLREFYKERDVVMEERRMRVESQPVGKLVSNMLSLAYRAHPTAGRASAGARTSRT